MDKILNYIPFLATVLTAFGLAEIRLAKKVDKDTFAEHCKTFDRLEIRMIRLEDHLIGNALTKKEVEAIVAKNNK